jgi:hypothetical protein
MNCVRARRALVDYAEDALADRKRLRVERHLSECEACRSELSEIEKVRESILSLEAPERDAEFWRGFSGRLSQRLASEGAAPAVRSSLWRPKLSFATAAVVTVLFVLGLVVLPRVLEWRRTAPELAPKTTRLETVESDDVEPELLDTYAYDEDMLALAALSSEEIEQLAGEAFLLLGEDWQPASDEQVIDDMYEQSMYDYLDDLAPEEYEEMYDMLESI